MFRFLKKLRDRARPKPWTVSVDDDAIIVTDGTGVSRSVAKSALSGVLIETNDKGPFETDVWWLLFDAEDQLACAYPQGIDGEASALDFMFTLPNFDHEQMIKAMGAAQNAVFPVWRRTPAVH